jgi:hypothetical protein
VDVAKASFQVVQHGTRGQLVQRRVSFIKDHDRDGERLGVVVGLDLNHDAFDALGLLDTVEVNVDAATVEWAER